MLRSALVGSADVDGHGFRIRSREVSRLEGLSDAVFGFAVETGLHALRLVGLRTGLLEQEGGALRELRARSR